MYGDHLRSEHPFEEEAYLEGGSGFDCATW